MTQTTTTHPPYRQLRRPTSDRIVAGVASGLGRYFNVDPTLVRVILAVSTVLTGGLALLTYPVMWFLMPEEPSGVAPWPTATDAAATTGPPKPDGPVHTDPPAAV